METKKINRDFGLGERKAGKEKAGEWEEEKRVGGKK